MPAIYEQGKCAECGMPKPYGHSRDCRWDHSCVRNDGGNPGRRCGACDLERDEDR